MSAARIIAIIHMAVGICCMFAVIIASPTPAHTGAAALFAMQIALAACGQDSGGSNE